ncbi:MAG: BrnA antitoxin family protein [bacterium]|nr:BrnA antitoxin family protein [bacterium]
MKKKLMLPKFKNEDEERVFWDKIDLSDYYDANDLEPISFPNLKPTTRPISIRIPEYLLNRIKEMANAMTVPYQSLIKQWLTAAAYAN